LFQKLYHGEQRSHSFGGINQVGQSSEALPGRQRPRVEPTVYLNRTVAERPIGHPLDSAGAVPDLGAARS
jgi:hypothetical protein